MTIFLYNPQDIGGVIRELRHPLELPLDLDLNIYNWISHWDTSHIGLWRTNEIPDSEKCIRDMIIFINQSRVNHEKKKLTSIEQNQIMRIFDLMKNWYHKNFEKIMKYDDYYDPIINFRDKIISEVISDHNQS